jgi:protein-S-isoprenylcysteine O-methyltransferase Ste14
MQSLLDYYYPSLYLWIGLSAPVFILLVKSKKAEYGKFYNQDSKLQVDNRLGWFLMECPTLILMPLYFTFGTNDLTYAAIIILGLYLLHYVHRTLIFPFRLKTKGKKMPVHIVISAMVFNIINTFFIGFYFGFLYQIENEWLLHPVFIIGLLIFFSGMIINIQSDTILLQLRNDSNPGEYKIPEGKMFKWVSCPNYLGEWIEWTGYAILSFSLPALAFAIWTFANLAPRALANHKWYYEKFDSYPKERNAILPFLL